MNKRILLLVPAALISIALYFILRPVHRTTSVNRDEIAGDKTGYTESNSINNKEDFNANDKDSAIRAFFKRVFSSPLENEEKSPQIDLRDMISALSKMEDLPEAVWIPSSYESEDIKKQSEILRDILFYGTKIKEGKATPDDEKRYRDLKIQVIEKKIVQIGEMISAMKDMDTEGQDQTEDIRESERILNILRNELTRLKGI